MSPFLITGLAAGVLGLAIGGGSVHELDANHYGAQIAKQQATYETTLNAINAASAKQLADALSKQQIAEGKVSDLETQYQTEVANHAKDSLTYRSQLASGAQRLRVHVTAASCGSSASSQSTAASSGPDDAAATADLSPTVATGVVAVADSADETAMRLSALQAYVKALQDQGFISK